MTIDIASFITELKLHFPMKFEKPENETAWLRSYYGELRNFEPPVLERAMKELLRKPRRDKRFPALAECIKECSEAKRWLELEENRHLLPAAAVLPHGEWSRERRELADQLVSGAMGKEAAKNGWIGILHEFCRKYQRLPDQSKKMEYRKKPWDVPTMIPEIDWCKREAKDFDEAYAACVRGGWDQAKAHEKMGADMLRRRNALADKVLRGR